MFVLFDCPYLLKSLTLSVKLIMKKISLSSTLLLPLVSLFAQQPHVPLAPSEQNHVLSRNYRAPLLEYADVAQHGQCLEKITYFDGLGRPIQSVDVRKSPSGRDIVIHVDYDAYGRQTKEYMPYPVDGAPGSYRTAAQLETETFYGQRFPDEFVTGAVNPYIEKQLENSPMARVLKQAAPGRDWRMGSGHEISFEHLHNTTDEVRLFRVGFEGNDDTTRPLLVSTAGSYYEPGTLTKTVSRDENHPGTATRLHTTEEFKDQQGRVVLQRTYAMVDGDEEPHDTYYVYDRFGNLSFIIPPKVGSEHGVTPAELSGLCYQYKYDGRNRIYEKKLPGKEPEQIVYDVLDQPLMTRDQNLRDRGLWTFTKYDVKGRIAYTGSNSTRHWDYDLVADVAENIYWNEDPHETAIDTTTTIAGVSVHYTNNSFPVNYISELHTVNYYDRYVDTDGLVLPTSVLGQPVTDNVLGLPTVSKVRVLGTDQWITTVTGYDEKGRAIYVASRNDLLGTTDIVETLLDFSGEPLEVRSTHTRDGNDPIVTEEVFTYDHAGRLLRHEHTLGGRTEVLAENSYDELDQLASIATGGGAQQVDHAYNVRGWLTEINDTQDLGDDLFALRLGYNTETNGATPLFNINIATAEWRTSNDNVLRHYAYEYDAMGRIKSAGDNTPDQRYSLQHVGYDKNGNIQRLVRMGQLVEDPDSANPAHFGEMDNLYYGYDTSSNQLRKVADVATVDRFGFRDDAVGTANDTYNDYYYDPNGNLLSDTNKAVGTAAHIEYNHLNMPTNIPVGNGNVAYVYSATGTKLKKTVGSTVTEYAGNFTYRDGELQFINTSGGYLTPDGTGGYDHVYQYKDNTGNVRLSYIDRSLRDADDFTGGTGGWATTGSSAVDNSGQRLNFTSTHRWQSANKYYDVTPGVPVTITFDFEKGSMLNTTLSVRERIDGEWESNADRDRITSISNGSHRLDMVPTGDHVRVYFEKSTASDDGTPTTCHIDNYSIVQRDLQIVEERNYYPFGLEHKGYNNVVNGPENNLQTYQGQEWHDDLGLNWHEWKYRMSDPALGRFISIDPLAEKYAYNSTYAFQENKLGMGIELEGAELIQKIKDWWFELGTRMSLISMNHPRNNPHSTWAKEGYAAHYRKNIRHSAPERRQPGKNITGNYFGDALLHLLGGTTVIDAYNGNQRAKEQLLLSWPFAVMPAGRAAPKNLFSRLRKHKSDGFIEYFFKDGEYPSPGNGRLGDGGFLSLDFKVPESMRGQGLGTYMYEDIVKDFGKKNIKGLQAHWEYGDNLSTFNKGLSKEQTITEAIFGTPTGKWAERSGYFRFDVLSLTPDENNKTFSEVIGIFHKSPNPKN